MIKNTSLYYIVSSYYDLDFKILRLSEFYYILLYTKWSVNQLGLDDKRNLPTM